MIAPEPGSLSLLAPGAIVMFLRRRRRAMAGDPGARAPQPFGRHGEARIPDPT
ncbi:MAG: PEP-CTERM sorting domain-containing protein [Bryobacteraceae bacterium]